MKLYFDSIKACDRLDDEVESWNGTRFQQGAGNKAKKGVYADCVSFVEKVMVNLKVIAPITWPPYVSYQGSPKMLQVLDDALNQIPQLKLAWDYKERTEPMLLKGDIVAFSTFRARHHLAISLGNFQLAHCIERYGVTKTTLGGSPLLKNIVSVWRPIIIEKDDE